MERRSFKGELLLVLSALLWSSGGLFIKMIPNLNGFVINGLRSLVAFLCLLAIRRKMPTINKTTVSAGIALAVCMTFFVVANKYTTAANAIVMQDIAPIYVLVISSIASRRLPKLSQVVIMLAAVFGIVLIFMDEMSANNIFGNLLGMMAGLGFALVFLINSRKDACPLSATTIGFFISFVVSIPWLFNIGNFETSYILPIIGLGLVQQALPYLIFAVGIKTVAPTTASMIALLEALLNPVWVFMFVGEAPGVTGFIGFFVVLIAITLNIFLGEKKAV